MTAYYNENDPGAAQWIRELIAAGVIAMGDVDERSIEDVVPIELAGYTQCHFFAGIGGWSYALRLAGWPDSRPAWTGSCPCQPFSAAGKRGGLADERHLWPAFWWLIAQCRPAFVLGEQVAGAPGREWLAGVRADLELLGYAVGGADLCAAGVGAPHIRQRLWWVAESQSEQHNRRGDEGQRRRESTNSGAVCGLEHPASDGRQERRAESGGWSAAGGCGAGGLVHADGERHEGQRLQLQPGQARRALPETPGTSADGGVGDAGGTRAGRHGRAVYGAQAPGECERVEPGGVGDGAVDAGAIDPWRDATWLPCADGKARRIGAGIEPLVDGLPDRVGLLRGYGNAIVPQCAAEFIAAYLEAS